MDLCGKLVDLSDKSLVPVFLGVWASGGRGFSPTIVVPAKLPSGKFAKVSEDFTVDFGGNLLGKHGGKFGFSIGVWNALTS